MSALQPCWQCGEPTGPNAIACPACGANRNSLDRHRVAQAREAARGPSDAERDRTNRRVAITGVTAAVLLVGGMMLGDNSDSGTASPVAAIDAQRPSVTASARRIFDAYQANEAAAQIEFGDRVVIVTGTVTAIDLDLTDSPVIMLETENRFMPMGLNLADAEASKAPGLTKGKRLRARCTNVHEIAGRPYADQCVLL